MLYELLVPLSETFSPLNVFRYITFRAAYATITALLIAFLLGPWVIARLRSLGIGQRIRRDGPETHLVKEGTPTMGGVLIVMATLIPTLLWADLRSPLIWTVVTVTASFGAVGFLDRSCGHL